jgi:hypothetical protein
MNTPTFNAVLDRCSNCGQPFPSTRGSDRTMCTACESKSEALPAAGREEGGGEKMTYTCEYFDEGRLYIDSLTGEPVEAICYTEETKDEILGFDPYRIFAESNAAIIVKLPTHHALLMDGDYLVYKRRFTGCMEPFEHQAFKKRFTKMKMKYREKLQEDCLGITAEAIEEFVRGK